MLDCMASAFLMLLDYADRGQYVFPRRVLDCKVSVVSPMNISIMATKTDPNALLARAIKNADENTLRKVLKSMCEASEACRKEAIDRMLVSRKRDIMELSDSSDDDTQKQKNKNKKQKKVKTTQISRFEICETCDKTYDVTLNDNAACQTHWDMLEIDEEFFPDDDEVCYHAEGIDVNTDWRRETCPEGFVWQCCDGTLNEPPCQIQRHIPKKNKP
ncbi:hypothetical protein F4680DRAFT_53909 [Xylaria scruposa]|nr:hypothetical protein F4680DRAFT_53909 [Xylaria scruposa]